MTTNRILWVILLVAAAIAGAAARADELPREILADLVAQNTAPSGGSDLRGIAELIVGRLKAAGYTDDDIDLVYSGEKLPNIVVRYRSAVPEKRPMLMMAHLDVVEALPSDWSVEPFALTESDGYYYGRGTSDNKAGAAILVANLIRLKREDYRPNRDLIVMLTADEETDGAGAAALSTEHRELIDAEFALNTDGGMVMLREGRARAFIVQTAEKVYETFELEATDPGGHSSLPRADSAISRIARTLAVLDTYRFPIDLNETTRAFFSEWLTLAPENERDLVRDLLDGETGAGISAALDRIPYYNAMARTTCVATQIQAGHAENALPQTATATVNCRVLPQAPAGSARAAIEEMARANDLSVRTTYPARPSPPSPLSPAVVEPIGEAARSIWPGIVVVPAMSTGATDGLFVRSAGIPVYGVGAIAHDPDDIRAHGQDERVGIEAFNDAMDYWYRLIRRLSSP